MPTRYVDDFEIEFTAEPLPGTNEWGAYVAIFGKSDNPMHLATLYPKHRIAADQSFASEAAAEAEAEKAAMLTLEQLRRPAAG